MKRILITSFIISGALAPAYIFAEQRAVYEQENIQKIQHDMRVDLREGRTEQARNNLERAVGNFHAVEIELGLIQTLMQAGEYRHALSAAAHTHAEHPNVEDSALLYAWLLAIGGQTTPAIQLLESTLERRPQNAALILMHKHIKASQLISAELKTSEAIQLKPFTSEKFTTVKPHKYLTTGVVINNGKHIITTLADVENATTLNVRDGLGREIMAHIEQKIPSAKLAVLKLDKPVKTISAMTIADKSPFPGTPIYIIGFSPLNQDQADWPQLRVDILGTPTAANHDGYPLHARFAPKGAGVFNQQGNLVGIVDDRNAKVMLPLTDNALTAYKKSFNSTNPLATLPMDEIYEMALINTVQVLGSD